MNQTTVVVSAGSYHLPFNRLIEWMQPWASAHPEVRVIVQHGPGRPLSGAENHVSLPYSKLLNLCADATVVVLQGGAGGVMDMRDLGRVPIVVPRVPTNGEVVDDHQLLFSERVASMGLIYRATAEKQLWHYLDAAVAGSLPTFIALAKPTPGLANLTRSLDGLPSPLSGRLKFRRLARLFLSFLPRF